MLTLVAVLLSATLLMGQTWEIVKEQSISFDPADVYFHDAQNGVLVGDDGAIYSTTDGAKTLTPVIAADPAAPDL
ncbi:MAG: Photosynthesis system assembly factor, partial [Candidatus Marinimicrobia bacterium]|nr:Photosynthesis system assembly factor [Candidatus Neomarinimicrobiota bacterium]